MFLSLKMKKKHILIGMPVELIEKLSKGAEARGVTRASYVKEILFQELKDE